jgi:hypothetical protein
LVNFGRVFLILSGIKRFILVFGAFVVLIFWLVFTVSNAIISFAFWENIQYNVTLSASIALVIGSFGLALRIFAGVLALIAVVYYLKNRSSVVLKLVSFIIAFEALHVLFYGFNGLDGLEYGDFVLIVQSSLNCIIGSIIVPIPLLVFSKKIKSEKTNEIIKWGFISGFVYIIMLWIRFASNWIAVLIQSDVYYNLLPGYGIDYITTYPVNLFSFFVTLIGLPLLAIFFIKTKTINISKMLSKIGWTLTFFGCYFLSLFTIYAYAPNYLINGASIWSSFFVGHNYDLWMISLPVIGVPLIILRD